MRRCRLCLNRHSLGHELLYVKGIASDDLPSENELSAVATCRCKVIYVNISNHEARWIGGQARPTHRVSVGITEHQLNGYISGGREAV